MQMTYAELQAHLSGCCCCECPPKDADGCTWGTALAALPGGASVLLDSGALVTLPSRTGSAPRPGERVRICPDGGSATSSGPLSLRISGDAPRQPPRLARPPSVQFVAPQPASLASMAAPWPRGKLGQADPAIVDDLGALHDQLDFAVLDHAARRASTLSAQTQYGRLSEPYDIRYEIAARLAYFEGQGGFAPPPDTFFTRDEAHVFYETGQLYAPVQKTYYQAVQGDSGVLATSTVTVTTPARTLNLTSGETSPDASVSAEAVTALWAQCSAWGWVPASANGDDRDGRAVRMALRARANWHRGRYADGTPAVILTYAALERGEPLATSGAPPQQDAEDYDHFWTVAYGWDQGAEQGGALSYHHLGNAPGSAAPGQGGAAFIEQWAKMALAGRAPPAPEDFQPDVNASGGYDDLTRITYLDSVPVVIQQGQAPSPPAEGRALYVSPAQDRGELRSPLIGAYRAEFTGRVLAFNASSKLDLGDFGSGADLVAVGLPSLGRAWAALRTPPEPGSPEGALLLSVSAANSPVLTVDAGGAALPFSGDEIARALGVDVSGLTLLGLWAALGSPDAPQDRAALVYGETGLYDLPRRWAEVAAWHAWRDATPAAWGAAGASRPKTYAAYLRRLEAGLPVPEPPPHRLALLRVGESAPTTLPYRLGQPPFFAPSLVEVYRDGRWTEDAAAATALAQLPEGWHGGVWRWPDDRLACTLSGQVRLTYEPPPGFTAPDSLPLFANHTRLALLGRTTSRVAPVDGATFDRAGLGWRPFTATIDQNVSWSPGVPVSVTLDVPRAARFTQLAAMPLD